MTDLPLSSLTYHIRSVAGWRSGLSRQAHNLKITSSNLVPALVSSGLEMDLSAEVTQLVEFLPSKQIVASSSLVFRLVLLGK